VFRFPAKRRAIQGLATSPRPPAFWRHALVSLALLSFAACEGGAPEVQVPPRAALPPADYRIEAEQFAGLQRAALAADYAAFAEELGARDTDGVTAELGQAFGGGPFDVYTAHAVTTDRAHSRLVELRGRSARLYLYLALDRVPGGWDIAGYQLGRDREAIAGRL
jgi:hypothetical protein